ncbi:Mpp10 protein [Mytilinidion resinicola]|uniref:U3 small nucleolar ribonucleoprotein protein MPP10 n=1 Tax=Mytilinidion resinicola TaxID=574789 RepID=A0A6A6YLH8_9PEZI|nr:Mpp10 protein [Mytilinidion resinicola]KAF2809660.1 Mpp10 protein [Mytilinidion resinicola]
MATLSFSPTTSNSSHTLSAQSAHPPPMNLSNPGQLALISSLSTAPHTFLQPPRDLHDAALALAKRFLDPLAAGVSETHAQRQKEERKKRKRGEWDHSDSRMLKIKKVHLDGFGVEQVWEQARRVLDATREEVEKALPDEDDVVYMNGTSGIENGMKTIRFDEDGFEMSGEDEDLMEDVDSDEEDEGGSSEEESGSEGSEVEDVEELEDEDMGSDNEDFDDEISQDEEPADEFIPDPNGLNDGFFSIDNFNKQSAFLEQQDIRGEAAASDDEEVDWDANPLSGVNGGFEDAGLEGEAGNEESDDDDEEGPTFGHVDLNAPEGESDDDEPLEDGDLDDLGGMTSTNNIMYADFFAPPAQKASKSKRKSGRPNAHNFPAASDPQMTAPEDNIERTMAAVHRDLFEDSDGAESNGDLSDLDPADPKSRRSAHQRRQAKIAEEIRKLEAVNVAKRDWTLSGEVRAVDRPINSLLEEDLEFERAGKPVPVITAEVSEDIEALIKRRIIAGEFDEVRRRRPDDLATGSGARRGRFELDDSKSAKGLAEIYEEDHLRKNDPNFVDAKDEKLKKEHAEIETLWRSVSGKLDTLCSWHYKPKPAAPSLEVRVDAPVIQMEDARPTTGGEANISMLAPQEVYKPGVERTKEEVVTKGGLPVARDEMSREEKQQRRRREKERIKKAGKNEGGKANQESKKSKEKKQLLGDLKKGSVKVIGKRGELRNVEGKEVKEAARVGGGSYKL